MLSREEVIGRLVILQERGVECVGVPASGNEVTIPELLSAMILRPPNSQGVPVVHDNVRTLEARPVATTPLVVEDDREVRSVPDVAGATVTVEAPTHEAAEQITDDLLGPNHNA